MALTDKLVAIGNAIRAKTGGTAKLSLDSMVTEIGKLWKPSSPTAAAGDVLSGKSFVNSSGTLTNGSMTNRGAVTQSLNAGGSYTIPAGYHNGSGVITANSLASQTDGDATAAQILSGKIAWVDGVKVTGTMVNNGAVNQTLAINGSYTIPAGYHNGSGKVTQSITTKAASTYGAKTSAQTISAGQYLSGAQTIAAVTQSGLTAANIVAGKTVTISSNGSNLWSVTGTASNVDVSGGTVVGSWTNSKGTVTVSSITGGVRMKVGGTDGTYSHVTLSSTIDVTNLTAIAITVNAIGGTYIGSGYHSVMTVRTAKPTGNLYTTEANTVTITGKGTFILNVASLTGKYYITVQPSYKVGAYIDVTRLIAF